MTLESHAIQFALVNLRTGALVRTLDDASGRARLELFAERAQDLVETSRDLDWSLLFARLGGRLDQTAFQEIVLVSSGRVYVLERLRTMPDLGLAAVALSGEGLGLVLSGVHDKRAELDRD